MNDCQYPEYLQLITLELICSFLAWYEGRLNHIKSKKFAFSFFYLRGDVTVTLFSLTALII